MTRTATAAALNGKLHFLRASAAMVAVGAVVQPLLAMAAVSGTGPLSASHGTLGMITFALGIVAAVASVMWARASGNRGLMWHGVGIAALGLVQVALGETGQAVLHSVLGIGFLIGAVALFTLAWRAPYGRSGA